MTKRQEQRLEMERERIRGMRSFENELVREKLETHPDPAAAVSMENVLIAGIDEAGRGPLAGPVAAGAVILPRDHESPGRSALQNRHA